MRNPKLEHCLFVGADIKNDGCRVKDYVLLKTNGVAEKVFSERNSQRPYTWMANVISVSMAKLGDVMIAANCRKEYLQSGGAITIPHAVMTLPLSDIDSLIIEIHRSLWKNLIRNQHNFCSNYGCGKEFIMDFDLNRLAPSKESLKGMKQEYRDIEVTLPDGCEFEGIEVVGSSNGEQRMHADYIGTYNKFRFRIPTLADGIRSEEKFGNPIDFWRHIAFDTLIGIEAVDSDNNYVGELPISIKNNFGIRLFDEQLSGPDLMTIREALRDNFPALALDYEEECPHCHHDTPLTVEASTFFFI